MKTESDILLEILGDKLVSLNATFLGQTAADPYINISAFPLVYEAMRLYSDQQNKELRERIAVVLSDSALGVEIQRLTTENKELEEKLMSEQIENGYLQAFRVSNEAEIQRLTKEVEQLRLKVEKWVFSGVALHAKNTRLRELLGETLKWLQWNSHSDAQLLASKIDNALNHKP